MGTEEGGVLRVLVEVVRGQYGGQDRDLGVQLHPHQSVDDGVRHELVAVDASVDDQGGADDGGVATAGGQALGVQRDLEGARDAVEVDVAGVDAQAGDLGEERVAAPVDQIAVPLGLDEGDPAGSAGRRPTRGISALVLGAS